MFCFALTVIVTGCGPAAGEFVGTWRYASGTSALVCSDSYQSSALDDDSVEFQEQEDGTVLTENLFSDFELEFYVTGSGLSAKTTAFTDEGSYQLHYDLESWTFELSEDRNWLDERAVFSVVNPADPDLENAPCTYFRSGVLFKHPYE